MSRYTSVTDADRAAMLEAIGVASVDDLFADIPENLRLARALDLPAGLAEQEVYAHLRALAARNVSAADEISFVGAGMYDHYVPALVDSIASRSEFLTPYTPYQPEISQGGLQVMFEYQTAISELTGLPVSNASVYEGPSAVGAAGYVARTANKRPKFVASAGLHPHSLETLRTMSHGYGTEVVEVPLRDGATDPDALAAAVDDDTGAVFLQQPNFFGAIEDLDALAPAAKATGALLVVAADPIPLALLKPPGESGADLVVGEGQPLGNRLDFGGPSFGFFAATEALLRRMPGRIAGETTDVDGRRGFVLTLQTREQHIRREKATSNICTAQALNALCGHGLPGLAGAARDGRAGRAAGAADGVCARHPGRARRRGSAARAAGGARVRAAARRARRAGARALLRARHRPRPAAGGRRPARRHHRAALAGGHRPAGRGARRGRAGGAP